MKNTIMEAIEDLIELIDKKFISKIDKVDRIKNYILKTYNDINAIENLTILANSANLIKYVIENNDNLTKHECDVFNNILIKCNKNIDIKFKNISLDVKLYSKERINNIIENSDKIDYNRFHNEIKKYISDDNEIKKVYIKYNKLI